MLWINLRTGNIHFFNSHGTRQSLTLRDRFLLDYGDLAISNPHLAHTAFVYWKSVPQHGIWRLEEVRLCQRLLIKAIVRVPLESQVQVDRLVDLCFDLHLESQRADLCKAWAAQLEEQNQVGLALAYFEKGQSYADIERICWNHFERLLLTGISLVTVISHLGGTDQTMDPKLTEMLQSPPQSPMSATLIAPVALLYNFYGLKVKGNAAAAVQYLSKVFRLSSMPRKYIALLMAEMLPIFDGQTTLEHH